MKSEKILSLVTDTAINYPQNMDVVPIGVMAPEVSRQNDKRPARLSLYLPDEWAKNLKGSDNLRDIYMMIRIDRERFDRFISPIVLP